MKHHDLIVSYRVNATGTTTIGEAFERAARVRSEQDAMAARRHSRALTSNHLGRIAGQKEGGHRIDPVALSSEETSAPPVQGSCLKFGITNAKSESGIFVSSNLSDQFFGGTIVANKSETFRKALFSIEKDPNCQGILCSDQIAQSQIKNEVSLEKLKVRKGSSATFPVGDGTIHLNIALRAIRHGKTSRRRRVSEQKLVCAGLTENHLARRVQIAGARA